MQPRSVRLNQDLRDEFVQAVVNEVMPIEKRPELVKFQEANAQAVYDATYGQHLDTMKKLPKWMLKEANCFHAVIFGEEIAFITPKPVLTFYKNDRTLYNSYGMHYDGASPQPVLEDDHDISVALKAYKQAIEDWKTKYQQLNRQIKELANNCNTTGQLFKTWPKAIEFAHVFPEPEIKERKEWKPKMDASELDLGVELSQVDVAPIREN